MGEVISYTKDGIEALIEDALSTLGPSGDSMGVVVHGADANVARPEGYSIVYWIGSVEPVNAEINDFRVDPDASPTTIEFATLADIDTAIAALVDTAPGALNTLNELAAALGDDANFAATITTALATKATSADIATAVSAHEADTTNVHGFADTNNAMRVVVHGAVAGTARPAGGASIVVHWIGTVEPTNAINNDVWTDNT